MKCWACSTEIVGEPQWMGHDGGDSADRVEQAYPMHTACADAPWPMYELTSEEAQRVLEATPERITPPA